MRERMESAVCIFVLLHTHKHSDSVTHIHPFCVALTQLLVFGQGLTEFAIVLDQ